MLWGELLLLLVLPWTRHPDLANQSPTCRPVQNLHVFRSESVRCNEAWVQALGKGHAFFFLLALGTLG